MRPWLLACLLILSWPVLGQSSRIAVEALSTDTAVLNVDGQRKMLRVGQSFGGVTLLASDTRFATVRVDGEEKKLGLTRYIGTSYARPEEQRVTIPRDSRMQYQTTALINGRSTLVMIDTGANVVAMSSKHAQALGIDYFAGMPASVETASGMAKAYRLTLRSVSIGGIKVDNVLATVVEGDYPVTVLMGMSYLQHVQLQEQNGVLSLSRVQ